MILNVRALRLSLLAVGVLALSACGGDNDNVTVVKPTPKPTPKPVVVQPFVPGKNAGYLLLSGNLFSMGVLSTAAQDAAGGYRALGDYTISTQTRVTDVASTAQFALGQWLDGTYTLKGDTRAIGDGISYVTYNKISSFGANAVLTCAPNFTTPWSNKAKGSMTGTAKLNINAGVANAEVQLALVGADKARVTISGAATLQRTTRPTGGNSWAGGMALPPA